MCVEIGMESILPSCLCKVPYIKVKVIGVNLKIIEV